MEFRDVIYGRRSVRKYLDRPVDDKILEEIIDAGLWAPSGVNLQPWYFVAVRSAEGMENIRKIMTAAVDELMPFFTERPYLFAFRGASDKTPTLSGYIHWSYCTERWPEYTVWRHCT